MTIETTICSICGLHHADGICPIPAREQNPQTMTDHETETRLREAERRDSADLVARYTAALHDYFGRIMIDGESRDVFNDTMQRHGVIG